MKISYILQKPVTLYTIPFFAKNISEAVIGLELDDLAGDDEEGNNFYQITKQKCFQYGDIFRKIEIPDCPRIQFFNPIKYPRTLAVFHFSHADFIEIWCKSGYFQERLLGHPLTHIFQ
jgi:hypothetical protein